MVIVTRCLPMSVVQPHSHSVYTVEPVYNSHLWDHAKWLLYRGGLLIEVGSAISGWILGLILLAGI